MQLRMEAAKKELTNTTHNLKQIAKKSATAMNLPSPRHLNAIAVLVQMPFGEINYILWLIGLFLHTILLGNNLNIIKVKD